MAYIEKRGSKWRALVRKAGAKPISKSGFLRKIDAEAWARGIEGEVDKTGGSTFNQLKGIRVHEVLKRFSDEVSPHRKGWRWEVVRLNALAKENWAQLTLGDDVAEALRGWRDDRLAGARGRSAVTASTVQRELNLVGGVFTHAIKEWGIDLPFNPAHRVKRPKITGGERDVTWGDAQLKLFLDHLEFDAAVPPVRQGDFLPWVLLVARHTGLRLGNVCEIMVRQEGARPWLDMSVPCIRYTAAHTKNANDYNCPLSPEAKALLTQLAGYRKNAPSGRLIEPGKGSIGEFFRRARREVSQLHPQLVDLRMHDLRHTWTTEMVPRVAAKGGDAMTMAKISGRRGTKSLFRYFNPKVEDLEKFLG